MDDEEKSKLKTLGDAGLAKVIRRP